MRILFIFPVIENLAAFNNGLGSVAAMLKAKGHEVRVFLIQRNAYAPVRNAILRFQPQIIAVTCYSNYWPLVKRLTEAIKRDFSLPVFAGGTHTQLFPECITETRFIDGVCLGEGEYAFQSLLERLEKGEDYSLLENFWIRKEEQIFRNPQSGLILDLDALPFPDRSLFPRQVVLNYPNLSFSRGCPFSCSYCCNNKINRLHAGENGRIRFKSVAHALEETAIFVRDYKPAYLCFDDDGFTKNPVWLENFCNEYGRRIRLPYHCNSRVEYLNDHTASLLKQSGCESVSIGIESGDEEYRKEHLNRRMSNEKIREAFSLAHRYGLKTSSFNMIGLPHETEKGIQKTIELNRLIQPSRMVVSIYYPYPGTELGDYCRERELVLPNESFNFINASVLKPTGISRKRLRHYARWFHFQVFWPGRPFEAVYYLLRRYFIFSLFYRFYKRLRIL